MLDLLFIFAHWHSLVKMRLHTDQTLDILDNLTTALGESAREFMLKTCGVFETRELQREYEARIRREAKRKAKAEAEKQKENENEGEHETRDEVGDERATEKGKGKGKRYGKGKGRKGQPVADKSIAMVPQPPTFGSSSIGVALSSQNAAGVEVMGGCAEPSGKLVG